MTDKVGEEETTHSGGYTQHIINAAKIAYVIMRIDSILNLNNSLNYFSNQIHYKKTLSRVQYDELGFYKTPCDTESATKQNIVKGNSS